MLTTPNYFIFTMDETRYNRSRKSRAFLSWSNRIKEFEINEQDQILIYLYDHNRVVAEYDIEKLEFDGNRSKIDIEPIYNAPPGDGVELDDLMLVQLQTYSSLDDWKAHLKIPVLKLIEEDYNTLIKKLTR